MCLHQMQVLAKCGWCIRMMSEAPYRQHVHRSALVGDDAARLCASQEEWQFPVESTPV